MSKTLVIRPTGHWMAFYRKTVSESHFPEKINCPRWTEVLLGSNSERDTFWLSPHKEYQTRVSFTTFFSTDERYFAVIAYFRSIEQRTSILSMISKVRSIQCASSQATFSNAQIRLTPDLKNRSNELLFSACHRTTKESSMSILCQIEWRNSIWLEEKEEE